jgi:hypothetical protein
MLLKLDTEDQTLHFNLERNAAPRVVMKMSNTSSSRVLFKVRTTQPLWYYVRPNQDILEAGQAVDLVFTLTEPESKRLLEQQKEGKEDSVEKHRFMVQGVALEQSDFDIISAMPADNRVAEVRMSNNPCLRLFKPPFGFALISLSLSLLSLYFLSRLASCSIPAFGKREARTTSHRCASRCSSTTLTKASQPPQLHPLPLLEGP